MTPDPEGVLGRWDATTEEICDAMNVGVRQALAEHKRIGNSVAVWDNETGEVRLLSPEEIPVEVDEGDPELTQLQQRRIV